MAVVKQCPACGSGEPVTALLCAQCGASLLSVSPSETITEPPPVPETPAAGTACPECGYANPPDAERCERCFSLLAPPQATQLDHARFAVEFPWGEVELGNRLEIGRDPGFSPLAERLAAYGNVSRRHAELRRDGEVVLLRDHGSTNGTFLDGERLPPERDTPVPHNIDIRFGATLTVRLRRR